MANGAHTHIEAVTVAVDYGDFLSQVAPHNRRLLDRWIVVTRDRDEETRKVCREHSIECFTTEDFDREDQFAKAHGINHGLRQCRGDGYLLHLDADIVLPLDFHQCLEDAQLRHDTINGCLRLCVPGWTAWQALQTQGLVSRQNGWLTEYRDRPAGSYVGGVPAGLGVGYAPIGYFQLWWGAQTLAWNNHKNLYPFRHGGAARSDTMFALQWDRRNRVAIPELLVFHLESGLPAHMGENWSGRKSPRFAPGSEPSARKKGALKTDQGS